MNCKSRCCSVILHIILQDEDPYVRKTAAVCVAKLHDISAARVEDQGFLETLGELLCDSNPMVVANAVAAISEILDTNPNAAKQVDFSGPPFSF